MTKNEFQIELYKNEKTEIIFLKVDGTERKMSCLRPDLIPTQDTVGAVEPTKMKKLNEDVMNVFSIEDNGWRSFRLENLISVNDQVVMNVNI
jgi:hypothetical protein